MHRRRFLSSALAAGSAALTGCSPVRLVNALVSGDGYARRRAIAYGPGARMRLDVYVPENVAAPTPIAVFFYGGSWASGDRDDYVFVGAALASRGIAAVIPDYRLYPEVRFPDFLDDCARAVRWTIDHAVDHNADPELLFLLGHSAGAYNAAMLALAGAYLDRRGLATSCVRGVAGLAGPYDFLPLQHAITKDVFGFPDTPRATQPIEFSRADAPPALLITGDADVVVDPGNSARFAARLRSVGARVHEIVYPGVGHAPLVGAFAAPLRRVAPVLDDVERFVRSVGSAG